MNLTAASVLVGGTLIESLVDRLRERQIYRENLDPRSALKTFLHRREKLDSLLSQRKAYVSGCTTLTSKQKEILDADGQVLQDLRDLASIEFGRVYCEVARIRSLRDLSNLTALLSASTAGYMGSLDSLLSVANGKPRQTGVAGLGFITSGSSVVASAVIISFGSKIVSRRASASTAFIAGSGVWTGDNIQGKVREELLGRKLKTAKLSVHAKLATDLENLQLMEDQVSVY